jgi:hypothetical protein
MPMIDFTYPEGALEPEDVRVAVDKMTGALLRWEGAPDYERTRALAWVFVHELPAGAVNVGGQPVERPVYRLFVTVPQGTLLHGPGPMAINARRGLIRELSEAVLAAEGTDYSPTEAGRVYCLIREIDDGYWGGMGEIFRMEDISSMASPGLHETALGKRAREVVDSLLATREQASVETDVRPRS